MKKTLLLAALALLGCGHDADPIAGPAGARGAQGIAGQPGTPGTPGAPGKDAQAAVLDGSRLKARYLVGSDGSKSFATWHDSDPKIGADCTMVTGGDGVTRCMPGRANVLTPVYGDSGCVSLVGLVDQNPPPFSAPPFVYFAPKGAPPTVFSAGALVSPVPSAIFAGDASACVDVSALLAAHPVYQTAAVSLDALVSAMVQ